MLNLLFSAALSLQSAPPALVPAPEPAPLSQQDRALLRCAAAFALAARAQTEGDADARQWPDLAARGREFFVRALAQLMEAGDRDRAAIAALANAEAEALTTSGDLPKVMPACLIMLEASGL
jgi:putative Ca2+/H+ antiporter (TMEM165/GDT1 family)